MLKSNLHRAQETGWLNTVERLQEVRSWALLHWLHYLEHLSLMGPCIPRKHREKKTGECGGICKTWTLLCLEFMFTHRTSICSQVPSHHKD